MPRSRILWQPGFSLSRKPVKKSIVRRNRQPTQGNVLQQYEFICEHPASVPTQIEESDDTTPGIGTTINSPGVSTQGAALVGAKELTDDYRISSPSSILWNSISHRFEPVLTRYEQEFCKIPLTSDLQINPFQYHKTSSWEPLFLHHAVMALAGHHVENPEFDYHRCAALHLLRESINVWCDMAELYHMLDTIIILFSLDETQLTLGNWGVHLMGAFPLLEVSGGMGNWTQSCRAVVQVGLLTWWDAIISLLSREDCVFPYSYFEAVVSNYSQEAWDYFRLCGCPLPLVKLVMQLARLGAEKRKTSSMRYVKFDDSVISEIEKALESWQHVSSPTSLQDEASLHQDMDAMHCSEAWRNGLLLYLYRVFQWEPGHPVAIRAALRARITADHVFACREDSLVAKQALLPLFFAGCELRDEPTREKILNYCAIWDDMTRYHMFNSTVPLLKEVWTVQARNGFDNAWWGQVVDRRHASESRDTLQLRICFG